MVSVIAEIGCNHMGSMDIAREMIGVASRVCKADVAKFQKRNSRELLTAEQFDAPHPVPSNAFGPSYGLHREALEFTVDQHAELKELCEKENLTYSCSVWDMTSAREIAGLRPKMIKIPSATNLNFPILDFLCAEFGGELHVSTGMTSWDELDRIVERIERNGRSGDLVLYACTSGYPVKFEDVCLLEIVRLRERYAGRIRSVAFSGHHLGIAVDVAALVLGVAWIERHFTLDRTWKGTDHAASLEPDGLRRLCRDLRHVELALKAKDKEILDVEEEQRRKLKWLPQ